MKIGEVFTVERDSTPSTGYDWRLVLLENIALIDEDFQYAGGDRLAAGNSGTKTWTFQAITEGTGKIQLAKYRCFEPDRVLYDEVLTYYIKEAEAGKNLAGGWSQFAPPESQERDLFLASVPKIGVNYTPLLVTRQTVNGVNYVFLANAKAVTPDAREYAVVVRLYADTSGTTAVQEIKRIGHPAAQGSFGAVQAITDEGKEALEQAFKHFVGMDFKALSMIEQIVSGKQYLFAGNARTQYPGAEFKPVLVKAYKPLEADARLVDIEDAVEL
jgi:predicted secreted protein